MAKRRAARSTDDPFKTTGRQTRRLGSTATPTPGTPDGNYALRDFGGLGAAGGGVSARGGKGRGPGGQTAMPPVGTVPGLGTPAASRTRAAPRPARPVGTAAYTSGVTKKKGRF